MNIITKEDFSEEVLLVMSHDGAEYMDAIITVAERRGIEIEAAANLLTEKLITFLELEARSLNLLAKTENEEISVFY
ncbi:RNA polymerase-associated protein [Ochrobactrum phage vB_OspM_OC]|nr:RNA polymerase-associated protein [Ochrobactrum phage vB_OspM_OC]